MKSKKSLKTIFTLCLSIMLIAVQCFGAMVVGAANDSASYNFDDWTPVPVDGVEGAYQAPEGWTHYHYEQSGYSEKFYLYKEDGAMGYKRTYTGADYNASVFTSIPTGLDKNDFFVDFASYWKSYVANPTIWINYSGPTTIFNLDSYISTNSWKQISVRFVKNAEGTYVTSLYINGEPKSSATIAIPRFGELRIGAQTWGSTTSGSLEFLLDNVNIRKTPTTLSVTPSVVNNATDVPTDEILKYELSQDIDKTTLELITVKDSQGNSVAANPTFDYRTKTINLAPALSLNKIYTVDLSKVKDVLGNSASVTSYTFTTAKQTSFIDETFDSYNAGENGKTLPVSSKGVWTHNDPGFSYSGENGAFNATYTNSGTSSKNPMIYYTLNSSLTAEKMYLDFDYKYDGGGTLAVKLYDSNKHWSKAEWSLDEGIGTNSTWHKLQAVITNGTSIETSSADIYIDGVYRKTVSPKSSSNRTWNGKLAQIAFQPAIWAGRSTTLSIDNMKLLTLPTELNVTSSLDTKSEGLYLGEDISFTFDNVIDTKTLANATVKTNGEAVGTAAYDASTKTITFAYDAATPLQENTTYTVDLSGVKDIFGNTPKTVTYTFSTIEKAGISIDEESFSVKEDGSDVKTEGFMGGEVTATVNLSNTSLSDLKVMVAVALYGKDSTTIKGIKAENVTIPCTGVPTPASVTLNSVSSYKDGDYIKVFVWEGGSLKPLKPLFGADADGEIN